MLSSLEIIISIALTTEYLNLSTSTCCPLAAAIRGENSAELPILLIRYRQGCTTSSLPFQLKSGDQVTIAGPSSGTIYQAFASGQTTASATLHYQTADGHSASVTKPFEFTINP